MRAALSKHFFEHSTLLFSPSGATVIVAKALPMCLLPLWAAFQTEIALHSAAILHSPRKKRIFSGIFVAWHLRSATSLAIVRNGPGFFAFVKNIGEA